MRRRHVRAARARRHGPAALRELRRSPAGRDEPRHRTGGSAAARASPEPLPALMPEPPPVDRHPVAYRNEEFLLGPDARPLRILAEYLEPLHHFRQERVHDTIVF